MLNIFTLSNGRLVQEEIESLEELSKFQPIWVDLESPSLEEKRWIKQYYGLSIPEDAMDEDIEESARFYEEDNGEMHIRSDFLIADADATQVRIAARALAGQSFAVETLPGCGYLQTVLNTIGVLVNAGKKVLVVAPRRQTLNELADRLSATGLAGVVMIEDFSSPYTISKDILVRYREAMDNFEINKAFSCPTLFIQVVFHSSKV
jgi:Mg2+ and Co2+ transporter CorA